MAELDVDEVIVGKVEPAAGQEFGHLIALAEELVTWGMMVAIVFGGVVPFIPQYRKIRRTSDAEGFSSLVCLVLLVANILRILFWFGKYYELPLLLQSIVMIITMMAMMQLCTAVTAEKGTLVTRRLLDFDYNYFWKWTRFNDYCLFVLLFSLVGGVVTFLLLKVKLYVELLGFASLLMEAMLGVPQLWTNFVHNSTEGMSVQMVLMWLSGDIFKTIYFILRSAPMQFWVCGGLQVMVDILILLQVALYRDGRVQLHVQPKSPRGKTTKISLT